MKKLRQREDENRRLKKVVAEQALDIQALKAVTAKTGSVQGEANGGAVDSRALWAEPVTGLSVARIGSEYAAIP